MSAPSICFVAPAIYPVLAGSTTIESVGGAEVQQAILARSLVAAGHAVSVVTMDYGQAQEENIDGIRVLRAHAPLAGLPGLRFVHPRMTALWAAMRRADAAIYYQRGSGMLTSLVAAFCRRYGRRFVFAAASDADFYAELPLVHYRRDKWLYRRGLRAADLIVVQNHTQQAACAAQFQRSSHLVPSCHLPRQPGVADAAGVVLWVGTVKPLKRPELLVELARRLPQLRFRLVGGGSEAALAALRAIAPPNLELTGFVPYVQVDTHFNQARVFVNTSEYEGFPNTFLQAWSRAIPSVSFFDTGSRQDGVPVTELVADLDAMAAAIVRLATDDAAWRAAGGRALAYFEARHTPAAALGAYQPLLAGLQAVAP
ncbi:glycosyltransferase [Duganella sp. FT135W]|uniref:Glycosyltransferase n=1 Tax=Duganella flavida TaxID=2692175 RepID=A0A6L8KFX6_9BURK|nr:glycosyltransferase [Duganella flavida]